MDLSMIKWKPFIGFLDVQWFPMVEFYETMMVESSGCRGMIINMTNFRRSSSPGLGTRIHQGLTDFFLGKSPTSSTSPYFCFVPSIKMVMIWGVVYDCFNHIKHHDTLATWGQITGRWFVYQPWEPPMPRGKESSNPSSYLEGACTAYFCWVEVSFWSFWSLILYLTTLVSSCFSSRSLETIRQ